MGDVSYKPLIQDMTWSYSRIRAFTDCPYRWYLKYIRYPKGQRKNMFFSDYGSFVHELIAAFYSGEKTAEQIHTEYLTGFKTHVLGRAPSNKVFINYFVAGSQYVWWKDAYGHEWRDRVFNRSVERAGCRICEEEFRVAFPRLLLSLYARRLGVQVINDGEELTGLPLENYIPDLRIAIETAERQKEEVKVKGYICEKRGIRYVWVPLRRKDSLSEYAQRMKLALQKVHVYFPSDEEQDVELLRRLFDDWRRKAGECPICRVYKTISQ